MRFDVFHSKHEDVIKDNGISILSHYLTYTMVGCSIGFDKGVNEFKVECIKLTKDVIAIMTNIQQIKYKDTEEFWINDNWK